MSTKKSLIQELLSTGYLKTPRIIDAFRAIDRADFVLPEYVVEAYGNYPLPIGYNQTISQPLTVAFMLELLDPQPGEKILDIGAGSGWVAALLAYIVSRQSINNQLPITDNQTKIGQIFAVERIPELCKFGEDNIKKYNLLDGGIVKFLCLDATADILMGPYDKIIAGAAASKYIPQSWRDQLKIGGKIVAPVSGSIWRFTKLDADGWDEKEFPGFAFVPLVHNN